MGHIWTSMGLVVGVVLVATLVLLAVFKATFVRVPADEAHVRTGYGGMRVYIGRGYYMLPICHLVKRVPLTAYVFDFKQSMSQDDVTLTIILRIPPEIDPVIQAAQIFNVIDHGEIKNLIEDRVVDHMRSFLFRQPAHEMHQIDDMAMHEFGEQIGEEIRKFGLVLESFTLNGVRAPGPPYRT